MKQKYLMADYYGLDKILDELKEIIGIEKFNDGKVLIDTGDELPDDITLKSVINFIHNYFEKKLCFLNKHSNIMWWKTYVRKNIGLRKKIERY